MADNADTKPKPANDKKTGRRGGANKKLMLVQYGRMGTLGWFEHNETRIQKVSTRVVVKTDRGLELGDIVGPYCYKAGQFRQNCEQVEGYYEESGVEKCFGGGGTFIRYATAQDISEERHLRKSAEEELVCCKKFVRELELSMRVIDAEHVFGGERIIFYFTSDGRVDFRELVKKLAREYQTRIEMRQIGSRDEAKLVADYETCGQECCCKRFLKILKPVNMRMAKLQKATLDPSKISGYCGRLRCCLRYEDQTYQELKERLPKRNSRVKTPDGPGKVVDVQILTQLVIVQNDNGTEVAIPVEEIEVISTSDGNAGKEKQADSKEDKDSESDKSETRDS